MNKYLLSALTLVAALAVGCNSDDDNTATPSTGGGTTTPPTNGPLTLLTPCSVQMTVNGTNVSYSTSNASWQCGNGTSGGGIVVEPGTMGRISFSGFITNDDGMTSPIDISLGGYEYPVGGPVPEDTFFGFFSTGSMPYGDPDGQLGKVEVSIWDNGVRYSTTCGSGVQTGSAFEIVQLQEFPSDFTRDSIKIRVTFNCVLYRCDGAGEARTITNGTAVVGIANWE